MEKAKGDRFEMRGYDVVARAMYTMEAGEVVVLNNNSTHYLVASRDFMGDNDAQATDGIVTLEFSRSYGDSDLGHGPTYRIALEEMIKIASSR